MSNTAFDQTLLCRRVHCPQKKSRREKVSPLLLRLALTFDRGRFLTPWKLAVGLYSPTPGRDVLMSCHTSRGRGFRKFACQIARRQKRQHGRRHCALVIEGCHALMCHRQMVYCEFVVKRSRNHK